MPRSTREKSKTGTCHVGLGRNQKPVPVISTKLTIRWGSNRHYRNNKIGSSTLRELNEQLRNTKLPGNNWRVNDSGHLHLKRR